MTIGETVLYTLASGETRPAIVVEGKPEGLTLAVFLTPMDRSSMREPTRPIMTLTGINQNEDGGPGTWRTR